MAKTDRKYFAPGSGGSGGAVGGTGSGAGGSSYSKLTPPTSTSKNECKCGPDCPGYGKSNCGCH